MQPDHPQGGLARGYGFLLRPEWERTKRSTTFLSGLLGLDFWLVQQQRQLPNPAGIRFFRLGISPAKGSLGALFMLVLTAHIREQGRKFPKLYSMTYPAHSVKVVGQVVHGVKHARQRLRGNKQVPQVRARISAAHPAAALRIRRPFVLREAAVLDIQPTF